MTDSKKHEPLTTPTLSLRAEVKLYYDLHAPGATPAPLLVALHGYGSNKGWMMREARQHAPEGFAVAALQGPHQHIKEPREQGGPLRYGFGWLTNFRPEESVALHHRALLDLIDALVARRRRAARPGLPPGLLAVVRAQLPLRLHARRTLARRRRHLRRPARRLGDERRFIGETRASVLYLHGTRDEFYPPERVADLRRASARSARATWRRKAYDAGHEFVPAMRGDVRAWLAARAGA